MSEIQNVQEVMQQRIIPAVPIIMGCRLRRAMEHALQVNEEPTNLTLDMKIPNKTPKPYIYSAVDDIMFSVNQTVQSSLASTEPQLQTSVYQAVSAILSTDFAGFMQRCTRQERFSKAFSQSGSSHERDIVAFLVVINTIDTADAYLKKIVESAYSQSASIGVAGNLDPNEGLDRLANSFSRQCGTLLEDSITRLTNKIIKPSLRTLLIDHLEQGTVLVERDLQASRRAADHDNTELLGDHASHNTDRRMKFRHQWSQLFQPFARIMVDSAFARMTYKLLSEAATTIEQQIWLLHGCLSRRKAILLEREVSWLCEDICKEQTYEARSTFRRCLQICMVMNLDSDDWEILTHDLGHDWLLDEATMQKARLFVVDEST